MLVCNVYQKRLNSILDYKKQDAESTHIIYATSFALILAAHLSVFIMSTIEVTSFDQDGELNSQKNKEWQAQLSPKTL